MKSFLSYTDSIELTTQSNGIQYYYIIGKTEDGGLDSHLMDEKPTEEPNGTEVKMAIGTCSWYSKPDDYERFQRQIREQLFYFDSLVVEGFDSLDNDFVLFEANTFKYRTGWGSPYSTMHIVLGKVVYPIDWNALGIAPVEIPVGLKFNIGELPVTINREAIRYKDEISILIRERIDACLDEIKEIYNRTAREVDTLEEYFTRKNTADKFLEFRSATGESYTLKLPSRYTGDRDEKGNPIMVDIIPGLKESRYKPFAHLPITIPKDPFFMFNFLGEMYECRDRTDAKFRDVGLASSKKSIYEGVKALSGVIYRIKNMAQRTKAIDKYLWWKHVTSGQHRGSYPVLLSIRNISYQTWCDQLEIGEKVKRNIKKSIPVEEQDGENGEVRTIFQSITKKVTVHTPIIATDPKFNNKAAIIREFKRLIIKEVVKLTESYEKQVPTPEYLSYLDMQRVLRRRPKIEGHISVTNLATGGSGQFDLSTLENYTGYMIYAAKEDTKRLRAVMQMLRNERRTNNRQSYKKGQRGKIITESHRQRFFIVGKTNFKLLSNNPYFMSLEQFMEGNNRLFINTVTAWYCKGIINKIKNKNTNLYYAFADYNKLLSEKLQYLENWCDDKIDTRYTDREFMIEVYSIAVEKNLLRKEMIEIADQAKVWFEGLEHLNGLSELTLSDKEVQKDVIVILKARKKRLSGIHYLTPEALEQLRLEVEAKEEAIKVKAAKQLLVAHVEPIIEIIPEEEEIEDENLEVGDVEDYD